jgi:GT2 family glycosyltransferase
MAKVNKGTVALGWCDNGNTDGKFTEGMVSIALQAPANGIEITHSMRVQGNQIGRQRQVLFDYWADQIKTDWLLWVDSDIVMDIHVLTKVWDAADKIGKPVVTGTYFISKQNEGTLAQPFPALFTEVGEHTIRHVHPLPENQVIPVDSAGFGFVLMHKSIIPKMREKFPDQSMFAEQENIGDKYVGEDIVFFRKMQEAGVPLYAHTGALVRHIKRFSLDVGYYDMYWTLDMIKQKAKEKQQN